jgi:hypothetical protein
MTIKFKKNTESKDPTRLDASETAIFQRQLEHVKAKTYDVKYKNLKATTLLPVDTSAPSGAKEITYRSYSKVGIAKIISDYANDFPRVDVYGEERTAKVRGIGDSYGYSIDEIRGAQMAGVQLDQRRSNAARRASDELVDSIAWTGDTNYGLQGFINYPGITSYVVPADGTGVSKLWSTKTPDQIVRDITGMIDAVVDTTNGREIPDTLLLPVSQFLIIANTRMTDGNDKTILTFIKENNPFLRSIEMVVEMKGAGAGSTDRMMIYTRSSENLTLEIPQPYEQFSPQQKAMEFVIHTHQKTGGVIIYYPLSVAYGDGI